MRMQAGFQFDATKKNGEGDLSIIDHWMRSLQNSMTSLADKSYRKP